MSLFGCGRHVYVKFCNYSLDYEIHVEIRNLRLK